MPTGSKVDDLYKKLRTEGKSEESAARIAQSVTGEALATGKPPKGHENSQLDTLETTPYRTREQAEAKRKEAEEYLQRKVVIEERSDKKTGKPWFYLKVQNSHFEAGRQRAMNALKMKNINGFLDGTPDAAYAEGRKCRITVGGSNPEKDNPYPKGSEMAKAWYDGWCSV